MMRSLHESIGGKAFKGVPQATSIFVNKLDADTL
jgi:hypothetical protein